MNKMAASEIISKRAEHVEPRKRLAYMFTVFFILLAVAVSLLGTIFFRSLTHIEDTTSYFRDSILPKVAATYELEINLLGSALNLAKFLNQPQAVFRERFEKDRKAFVSFLEIYAQHAQNEHEHAYHEDLKRSYDSFVAEGLALFAARDANTAHFTKLRRLSGVIYRIVESEFLPSDVDLGALQEVQRLAKLLDHELDEMVIEAVIQTDFGLDYHLDRLKGLTLAVNRQFLELHALPIAVTHAEPLRDMRSNADDVATSVEQIIRMSHEIRAGLDRLIDLRRGIDDILDEGIQEIAVHQLAANMIETRSSIQQATLDFLILIALMALITIALGFIFLRRVLRPIAALTRSVEAYERGELSIHPNITQRDEIGFLAERFATMAKTLAKSRKSLFEANTNLESKIAARTAEVSEANRALLVELEKRTQTEERLLQATESAIQASQAKSTFLASMSHELRTPLNAILGFSDVMSNEMFGPMGNSRYKDYATDIQNSGQFLLQLIDDLLTLGAIDEGRLKIAEAACDPHEITDEVMQLVSVQANAAQIGIRCRFGAGLGRLYADRRHIKQILINLVVNAVKFTDAGGHILIRWRMRHGDIELAVIDTGAGIPPDEVETMFTRYQRGNRSIRLEKQGVGLGLSIVKGITQAHGAEITVKSRVGHGTTITVRFPASRMRPVDESIERAIAS